MNILASVSDFANSPFKRFLLLFCIGLAVRMGYNTANGLYLFTFPNEPQNIAHAIVRGEGFSNPFILPTGPSAHLAPGFPFLLAGIYKVFGNGVAGLFVADLMNSAISASVGALLPVAGILCGADPPVAFAAGLLYAMVPPQPYTESKGGWEAPAGALLLLMAFILVRNQIAARNLEKRKAAAAGLLTGLSGLFLPTLGPVIVGFIAIMVAYKHKYAGRAVAFASVAFLVALAVVAPWFVRNRIVFGQWVPIRDNLGLELHVAYWDKAAPSLKENLIIRSHFEVHPHVNASEALKVRKFNEVEYNKRQMEAAEQWIMTHPSRFLQLTLKHFKLFWLYGIRSFLLIPFFLVGLWWIATHDRASFYLLATIFAIQPLIYYFVQFDPRYRHPLDWAMVLTAVVGASYIYQRARAFRW